MAYISISETKYLANLQTKTFTIALHLVISNNHVAFLQISLQGSKQKSWVLPKNIALLQIFLQLFAKYLVEVMKEFANKQFNLER